MQFYLESPAMRSFATLNALRSAQTVCVLARGLPLVSLTPCVGCMPGAHIHTVWFARSRLDSCAEHWSVGNRTIVSRLYRRILV